MNFFWTMDMIEEDAKHKTLITSLSPTAWKLVISISLLLFGAFYIHSCNSNIEKDKIAERERLANRTRMEKMKEEGKRTCRNQIRNQTNHNVNFVFGGSSVRSANNSFTIINVETYTKNAYGQKIPKRYFCKLSLDENNQIQIVELR